MIKAPSSEVFEEIKAAAIAVWQTYDDQFGYVTEKVERINNISNIQDNVMTFWRMFDNQNQRILQAKLSPASLEYLAINL